ncbi:MAG: hypothetical protein RIT27_1279 [Pseudomonadota bacterium]|jgi:signal transduction histidine kinase
MTIPVQHEYRLFALLLIGLEWSLSSTFNGLLVQIFLLLHFSIFLIWVSQRNPLFHLLSPTGILTLILIAFNIVFAEPILLLGWKFMLIALLASNISTQRISRLFDFFALLSLFLSLFLFNLNYIANIYPTNPAIELYIRLGLTALFLPLFILSDSQTSHYKNSDFFMGLTTAFLGLLIALNTLLLTFYGNISYPLALTISCAISITFIWVFILIWFMMGHIQTINQLSLHHNTTHEHNFEQWIAMLIQPGIYKTTTPQEYLEEGLDNLQHILPNICGLYSHTLYGDKNWGETAKHTFEFQVQSLEIIFYSKYIIYPNYQSHIKLLIQLLEHFHQAKRREEILSQQAHLQAIYETGAKLTHDMKNILQSLKGITSIIEGASQPENFGDTQKVLQGQFPYLGQRLQRILDKIQQPLQSQQTYVLIREWWTNLQARYHKRDVGFSANMMWNSKIPEEIFDNVVENLLENAFNKRQREPDLHIQVSLETTEKQVRLIVCDNGSIISEELVKQLLTQPVPSRDGYGVGLYQVAKQTIHSGYRLSINHNEKGKVCFELVSV